MKSRKQTIGWLYVFLVFLINSGYADIPLRGFSDATYEYSDNPEISGKHSFAVGQFDFFLNSALGKKAKFLAEAVFEFDSTNTTEVKLERLLVKYDIHRLFEVTAGRVHTALGFYNQQYHHGSWLETAIDRPLTYSFENDSILPIHLTGLEISGLDSIGQLGHFGFIIGVGNGRGTSPKNILTVNDSNNFKALNGLIFFRPSFLYGLQLGFGGYWDKIEKAKNLTEDLREVIAGVHLIYDAHHLQFMAEGFRIHHHGKTSGEDLQTYGYYAQLGYEIEQWTPYIKYDQIDFPKKDDRFWANTHFHQQDLYRLTGGLRFDITDFNALKFEYRLEDRKGGDSLINALKVQTAWTF